MKTKKCSSCQVTNKNIASSQKSVKYSDLMKQITKNIALPDLSKPKLFEPSLIHKRSSSSCLDKGILGRIPACTKSQLACW